MNFLIYLVFLFNSLTGNVESNMADDIKRAEAYRLAQQMDQQGDVARMDDKEEKLKDFLEIISKIESSGGQNFDHKEIQSGMHEGHRAAGSYGLMPNTTYEVLNRMRQQGPLPEELHNLRQMEPDEVKSTIESNPEIEQKLAERLGQRVLDRQGGDEEKAAYSWFQGHNLTPEKIESKDYANHDYVNKYNKYKGK